MKVVNLEDWLSAKRQLVDKALDDMLPKEDNTPAILHRAMRYSVFAGGKRVRPILAIAAADVVNEGPPGVSSAGGSSRVYPHVFPDSR